MQIKAIKTKKVIPPKDNLKKLLDPLIPQLKENMIIAITSKVVSICEGRCFSVEKYSKDQLAKKVSKFYIERTIGQKPAPLLTITNNLIIGSAGIDESNSNGYFILLPKNPFQSAEKICKYLKTKSALKHLGVIITDSHSIPLRRGCIGISVGFFGFEPLKDYRHTKDLFGRKFHVSVANYPDALAAAAVIEMGEGAENTPVAFITDLPKTIKFTNQKYQPQNKDLDFYVDLKEDLFEGVLTSVPWKKGHKTCN